MIRLPLQVYLHPLSYKIAYVTRDPCYEYLDLFWTFVETVLELLAVCGSDSFSSQYFNSRNAVSIKDKLLIDFYATFL